MRRNKRHDGSHRAVPAAIEALALLSLAQRIHARRHRSQRRRAHARPLHRTMRVARALAHR